MCYFDIIEINKHLLTDETSKGKINIINNEKYHAMSTEIVTII